MRDCSRKLFPLVFRIDLQARPHTENRVTRFVSLFLTSGSLSLTVSTRSKGRRCTMKFLKTRAKMLPQSKNLGTFQAGFGSHFIAANLTRQTFYGDLVAKRSSDLCFGTQRLRFYESTLRLAPIAGFRSNGNLSETAILVYSTKAKDYQPSTGALTLDPVSPSAI